MDGVEPNTEPEGIHHQRANLRSAGRFLIRQGGDGGRMISEALARQIETTASREATHIGFILGDLQGRYLFAERPHSAHGVTTTFPRARILPGECISDALRRCIRERVGLRPESVFPLAGVRHTGFSSAQYYAGLVSGFEFEAPAAPAGLAWYLPEDGRQRLSTSENAASRERDLAVLSEVGSTCLSPLRRILLAVGELHGLGFERLRAIPYFYSNGGWRCAIVPVSVVSRSHGAKWDEETLSSLEQVSGTLNQHYIYSSASEQAAFNWDDAWFDSPQCLARKFIERVPAWAYAGWGRDPAYAQWYEDILKATQHHGVFFSWDETEDLDPADAVRTLLCPGAGRFPLPPPGEA